MKQCTFCSEEIQNSAKKCRFCGEWIKDTKEVIENIPVVSKTTQWVHWIPYLGGILIFVGLGSVANGDAESIGYMIAGITTLLGYFAYKSSQYRIQKGVFHIREILFIVLLLFINISFIISVGGNYLVNNPISVLPFCIFLGLYLKLNFFQKDIKVISLPKLILCLVGIIVVLLVWETFRNYTPEQSNISIGPSENFQSNTSIGETEAQIEATFQERFIQAGGTMTLYNGLFPMYIQQMQENEGVVPPQYVIDTYAEENGTIPLSREEVFAKSRIKTEQCFIEYTSRQVSNLLEVFYSYKDQTCKVAIQTPTGYQIMNLSGDGNVDSYSRSEISDAIQREKSLPNY